MIYKKRGVSMELQIFRCLKNRMMFTEKEKIYYINLEKGYEGELKFDQLTNKLMDHCLIINDLTIEVGNNIFQMDSLLICKDAVFVFEVKNYEDNFFIESNKWYSLLSRKEINNPLLQLDRSETLLRKYLHNHRYTLPIESKVVFINPTFTLYQAPIGLPVVFPTQLQHLLSTLQSKKGVLTSQHTKLAKQLCSDHIVVSPYTKAPNYCYESLRKGIECRGCGLFYDQWGEVLLHCKNCGDFESIELAFVRSIKGYKILFPQRKITTKDIYEWCKIIPSMRLVRMLLDRHLKSNGIGRSTYYEFQ